MEKIEAGQTWLTRNGDQVSIDKIVDADPHPVKSGEHLCWQDNGRYWDNDLDHSLDLVKLIE